MLTTSVVAEVSQEGDAHRSDALLWTQTTIKMLSVVEDITPHCFGRTSAGGRAHFASSRSLSCGLPRSLSLRRHWVASPISIRVVVFYRRSGTFSSLFNGHVGCPMVALRSSAMGSTGDVTSCPPLVMTGADSRTAHRNQCQRVRCVASGGLFCLWPLGRLFVSGCLLF